MISVYAQQLAVITEYVAALNAAEKAVEPIEKEHPNGTLPYMKAIQLTDSDGTDWGQLRDEIGGEWCWYPPEDTDEG